MDRAMYAKHVRRILTTGCLLAGDLKIIIKLTNASYLTGSEAEWANPKSSTGNCKEKLDYSISMMLKFLKV